MGRDKSLASQGKRRVPERTLFLIALLGGAFGVFAGMRIWRHKTKHRSFRIGIPLIIALHIVGMVIYRAYLFP